MDLQETPRDPALPAVPSERRVAPLAWGAAGGGVAALLWARLLSLGVLPDFPLWLEEGLAMGLIMGLAYGLHTWRGRRDGAAEGAKGFAFVLVLLLAINFLSELIRG